MLLPSPMISLGRLQCSSVNDVSCSYAVVVVVAVVVAVVVLVLFMK